MRRNHSRGFPAQRQLVLPLVEELERAARPLPAREVVEALADRFQLSEEERQRTVEVGGRRVRAWARHVRWAYQQSRGLGLAASPRRSLWEATGKGRSGLRNASPGVVISVLFTERGAAFWTTAETFVECIHDGAATLILTSPPYLLTRPKPYGGPTDEAEYIDWIVALAHSWRRILAEDGTLCINLGAGFRQGEPVLSLYREKIYLRLCEEVGLHLAQDSYWSSPTRLPGPAQYVTVERQRLKAGVEHCYLFSRTPRPKWDNRRVAREYSPSMKRLLARGGGRGGRRPSGHVVRPGAFAADNGGSIPSHLVEVSHSASNDAYLRHCRENGLPVHPARFPGELVDFYVELCTEPGDLVVDCFAGSLTVAERAEMLDRRWLCCERSLTYLAGGGARITRFPGFRNPHGLPGLPLAA